MSHKITENDIELCAIEELEKQGFHHLDGANISPEGSAPERDNFSDVLLIGRLRHAVAKLNPSIPFEAQDQAIKKIVHLYSPDLLHNNESFHELLVEKVKIPYQEHGYERSYEIGFIDFEKPLNNEFLVVNQFTVIENNYNKRPDILLFINGIPLVLFELKNATDANTTIHKAYDQIQNYISTIPNLFTYNAFCVISDGLECRAGSITSGFNRFMAWKTSDGKNEASKLTPQIETLIKGMLTPATLIDLIRNFIIFEKSKKEDPKTGLSIVAIEKKIAAYHQYYAVNKAIVSTLSAAAKDGNRKGGVVWHTQGSGKSLSMVFFTGKLVLKLNNPTVIVITDRNDLDDQLFETFVGSKHLLRQQPVQAKDRIHLKKLLNVASGGIIFTTIQKFLPDAGKNEFDQLSERTNIVVIADEAHRTQYGFDAKLIDELATDKKTVIGKRIAYGFAKYMRDALPNATYIGFTGTPIEKTDINTAAVFGNYVDIYDIAKSIADGATVKIYYESRLAKVKLPAKGKRLITELDQELENDVELTDKQRTRAKWSKLEAIVGNDKRLKILARDIICHYEARQSVIDGKAMIVTMSRRIAADLYKHIIALRPHWHDDDPTKGVVKVVMTTASSDTKEMQKHNTTKAQRQALSDRMKDPDDSLKLVIVRDMWLTGFDAPCLHTMYIDKPMQGHTLMQAIARVNRVFKDKRGGLVVDYLGIASDLKKALSFYSESGGKGNPAETQEQAVQAMLEKSEVVAQMFSERSVARKAIKAAEPLAYYGNSHQFNLERFYKSAPKEKLAIILQAEEHILGLEKGKIRFIKEVTLLSEAFALSIPHEQAFLIRDKVAFYQAVKARLVKFEGGGGGTSEKDYDTAIKQVIDRALSSDKVIDIFDAAGIRKPELSILSEEFLLEIKGMQHKNLAFELLKKILRDEIHVRSKYNLVNSRALLAMLEGSIKKYQNNLLSTAEIIQRLIEIARGITASDNRGKELNLSKEELAFYDALEVNDSAVEVLGNDQLRVIAREIAEKVRSNTSIDWTIRESARAKLMVVVKRTLTKHGYPPDKQKKAIDTVLKQAELLADYFSNN